MVALIRLKKSFPYPADFKERVRQFNNRIVNENAKFVADLMQAVPGMKITRFTSSEPTDDESSRHDALIAERDAMHENAVICAA